MKKINKVIEFGNIKSMNKDSNLVLVNDNDKNIIGEFYFDCNCDGKVIRKFIKKVESSIRKSIEYTKYLGYLNNELGIHQDSVKAGITDNNATLEYHHYPFTLYDIVEIVVNKKIMNKEQFNSFSITKEVLQLHYDNKIGLVKLSKTMHELVHSGELYIPMDSVFGNVNEFINDYYDYIFPELIEKYNSLINL